MADDELPRLRALVQDLSGRLPRAGLRRTPSMQSVIELAEHDERETAIDWLCGMIRSYDLPLTPAEFAWLSRLARRYGVEDLLEDVRGNVREVPGP